MSESATRLTRLFNDERRGIATLSGRIAHAYPVGIPITEIVENPVVNDGYVVEEMVRRESPRIQRRANAYIISNFDPGTQHVRNGRMYSVYAVQFYYVEGFEVLHD